MNISAIIVECTVLATQLPQVNASSIATFGALSLAQLMADADSRQNAIVGAELDESMQKVRVAICCEAGFVNVIFDLLLFSDDSRSIKARD